MPSTNPYTPVPGPYIGPTTSSTPPIVPGVATGTTPMPNPIVVPASSNTDVSTSSIPGNVPSSGNTITTAGTNSNVNLTTSNVPANANLAISNLVPSSNTVYNVTTVPGGYNTSIQYNNYGQFAGSGTFRFISSVNAPGITASVYNNGFGGLTGCAPVYFYNPNVGGGNVAQGMINWFTGITNSSVGGTGVHISPWPNYGTTPVRNDAGITVYRGPSGVFYRTVTNINASQTGPGPHGLNLFDGSMYVNSYDRGSGNTSGVSQIILNAPYSSGRAIGQISSFAYTSPDQGRMWTLGWRQGSADSPNRAQEETPGNINISWNSNNRVGINGANLTESFNVKGNVRIQATGANSDTGILFADGTFQYTAANGGGGSSSISIQEEGTNVVATANIINFVGSGVTASNVSGVATITVPGGISGVAVQEEGTNVVSSANTINFIGSGVTASNVGNVATITVTGGNGISGIDILYDTSPITANATAINFFGPLANVSNVGFGNTTDVGIGLTVQDESTVISGNAAIGTLNFLGAGVTVTAGPTGVANITISSGSGTPGSPSGSIQFNDGNGGFGGNNYFTYNNVTGNVDMLLGNLTVSNGNITGKTNGVTLGYKYLPGNAVTSNRDISSADIGGHIVKWGNSDITLTVPGFPGDSSIPVGTKIEIFNANPAGNANIVAGSSGGTSTVLVGPRPNAEGILSYVQVGPYEQVTLVKLGVSDTGTYTGNNVVWFCYGSAYPLGVAYP